MRWRAAVFFLALVVLARSISLALQSLFAVAPALSGLSPDLRYVLTHVPFVVIVALLLRHADVARRLPPGMAWYALLAILAAAKIAFFWVSFPGMWAIVPLLLVVVMLVLLRLAPRTGDLYQSSLMPGFTAFLGFSLLLASSWPLDYGVWLVRRLPLPPMTLPVLLPNLAIAMLVAALFILLAGLRHRSMQPNPSAGWLWIGIVLTILVEAANIAFQGVFKPEYVLAVRVTAHLALFVGSFYLLSHLLPRRAADELH